MLGVKMAVAVSCQHEECGEAFTLSDLPVRCRDCKRDFCFDHREPESHDCSSLPAIPIERVKRIRQPKVMNTVPSKHPSVSVVDLEPEVEIVSMPERPRPAFVEIGEDNSFISREVARVGLLLVIGVFIVLTRYILF